MGEEMHIEKMENGLSFLQGTLDNVPFPPKNAYNHCTVSCVVLC